MSTTIIAHRGFSSLYPENTMLAFRQALEVGATGLECDIQLSRDGQPVIFHDENLYRIIGQRGLIKDFSWSELAEMDAGRHRGEEFRGELIPSLSDLLNLAQDREILLNLELKNGVIPYPNLEKIVARMVEEFGLTQQVIISSFNHPSLLTVKELNPGIKTALLYFARLYRPWNYATQLQVDGLHPFWMGVDQPLIKGAHRQGLFVNTFTVNSPEDMRRFLKFGVDGIVTDFPDRLAAITGAKD